MPPLPPLHEIEPKLANLPNAISAYRVCLRVEGDAVKESDHIAARVLGYLILHTLSSRALAQVVKEIHSCHEDQDLYALGQAFTHRFIREFRKNKGRTPWSSDHPSRPSFEVERAALLASIKEAPKDHSTAKKLALERDSYRCLVTGRYDALAAKRGVPLSEIQKFGSAVHTECAHIVPASTYFNLGASEPDKASEKDYAASVLAVLQRFGYNVDQLNGEKVHSLFNVMTLEKNAHDLFEQLILWLEATDTPNCYRVGVSDTIYKDPGRELVTFTTSDPEHLPLPSAELLALHATCAKVAHLSGASEYLNKFDRDVENMKVMAFDGGSFETLNYALAGVAEAAVDVGA